MSETPEIRIEMRSNPLYLSGAREMVGAIARRLCFSDEACGQIALALDEALCNVIRHGYQRRADGPIWISIYPITPPAGSDAPDAARDRPAGHRRSGAGGLGGECDSPATALTIVIEDEARQIDPELIRSRDLDQVRPGGLGVHIIRAVMDEVRYEKRDGLGMRLIMTKYRAEAGEPMAGAAGASSAGRGGGATEQADG